MITSIVLFAVAFLFLFIGIPVAFAFGMAAVFVVLFSSDMDLDLFSLLPLRIYGTMTNNTLMAMPLFIFMGLILERSGTAKALLQNIGLLFGRIRGGMAMGVVAVGVLLAASTGVVGASVVMMGIIAIPSMLRHGFSPRLSGGVVAASGTLGQIIPPSIVLIVLGDVMQVSVGDLFAAALLPSAILVGLYVLYIALYGYFFPLSAPALKPQDDAKIKQVLIDTLKTSLPPILLIIAVLGGIFLGIATPTEAGAFGALGAVILIALTKNFSFETLRYAAVQTVIFSGMIFGILIGASAFTLVFNEAGGGDLIFDFFSENINSKWTFIIITMLIIFVLGFFIDFIEISFVVLPLFIPLVAHFDINPVFFTMLVAINLQTSFLTPPFGFSLFYLKGAVGDMLKIGDIYKGVLPFIAIEVLLLLLILIFPGLIIY